MLIFRGSDGRTQQVQEREVVRIAILVRLGWKLVESEESVAVEVKKPAKKKAKDDAAD